MSQESSERAERLRRMFDTFNRDGYEAASVHVAPDTVWHTFPEWPGAAYYEGREGVGRLVSEWTENFDSYQWQVEEIVERGETVIVLARHGGRSKVVGATVGDSVGGVFTDFDADGRAREARFYTSWDDALAAAGD
jgi:ketosteroid isomerase-like protein